MKIVRAATILWRPFFCKEECFMNIEITLEQAIRQMSATHPHPSELQIEELTACIEACVICATTCAACADACLAEEMVKELVPCIRTNLDCSAICRTTCQLLVRQTEPDWRLLYHQVEACQAACRACASICEKHAEMHEHCRVCGEVCRQCEQACDKLQVTFPV
jgi:hypothetical protein